MKEYLLPHYDERKTPVDMLVLHATAHQGIEVVQCLDSLKLSAHYVLTVEGELLKLVDEQHRAWHAGAGFWRGTDADLNSHSIGIEICSPSLGQEPFAEAQIEKLIPFCQKLIRKYKIVPQNIVGHSDIAPQRKPDPGMAFPWKRLAKEGIGLWYQPKNAAKMPETDIARLLGIIGYDVRGEDAVKASAYAFCRHFAPQYVTADKDVYHLVENILPAQFDFMREEKFLQVLKAVAYSYQNLSQSSSPCKM